MTNEQIFVAALEKVVRDGYRGVDGECDCVNCTILSIGFCKSFWAMDNNVCQLYGDTLETDDDGYAFCDQCETQTIIPAWQYHRMQLF